MLMTLYTHQICKTKKPTKKRKRRLSKRRQNVKNIHRQINKFLILRM